MSAETVTTVHRARTARRAAVVLGATATAVMVWLLAGPIAGVALAATLGGTVTPIGAGAVAVVSLAAGCAGWALLVALERWTARARLVWTVIALAVLLLSLAGPLGGAGIGSVLALGAMHVATAAVLVPLLPRR